MYGLIGRFTAAPGKRDVLIAAMTEEVGDLPGCLSFVVAKDLENPDSLWITEVWADEASHKASLEITAVKASIAKAMPIIASFDSHIITEPVGGIGL